MTAEVSIKSMLYCHCSDRDLAYMPDTVTAFELLQIATDLQGTTRKLASVSRCRLDLKPGKYSGRPAIHGLKTWLNRSLWFEYLKTPCSQSGHWYSSGTTDEVSHKVLFPSTAVSRGSNQWMYAIERANSWMTKHQATADRSMGGRVLQRPGDNTEMS